MRPAVLRGWRPPPAPWAAGHRGADLAARPGERVRAAAAGRVSFVGPVAGRGVLVIELSGTGSPPLRTTYEPMRATVRKGERVAAGQVVGVVAPGPFHCPPGCLHWGLRRADRYLDPLSLLPPSMLRGGPSRLLPVFGVRDAPMVSALASPAGDTHLPTAAALMAASLWARIRLGRPNASRPRRPRPGRTRIRSRRGAPRTRSRPGHAPRAPGDPHAQVGRWAGGQVGR
ncbi:M23 family metallopeptidase [Streptomyces malaysiensis]|uniref:M23 family metallopeptidase n=1 Tax=Streptomyces malaysiensis TaxID=92644 RepID=UPI003D2F99C4